MISINSSTASLTTVSFRNTSLMVIEHNGEPYVALRQVADGMRLDWRSQYVKLTTNPRFCVVEITTQVGGQRRAILCMPLRKLPGWLLTIHPEKVKPELRDTIIAFQTECDDVLWQHWNARNAARALPAPESAPRALPTSTDVHARIARRAMQLAQADCQDYVERMTRSAHLPPVCFNPDTWTPEPRASEALQDLDAALAVVNVFGARLQRVRDHFAAITKA